MFLLWSYHLYLLIMKSPITFSKAKTEIIDETAGFYNSNNRGYSVSTQSCVYLDQDGNMCAVGRCLSSPETFMFDKSIVNIHSILIHRGEDFDDYLKPEYRGHDISFWRDLQYFHDSPSNWNEEGLTEKGKEQYTILLNRYENI